MIWVLLISVLVLGFLYCLWQMELTNKSNKKLKRRLAQCEQELLRFQQSAFFLAEQQKAALEQRLEQLQPESRLTPTELKMVQVICQLLPQITKDFCVKNIAPSQSVKSYLNQSQTHTFAQFELFIAKHSRLSTLWRNNTLMSYLQLCNMAVFLAEETQANLSLA